MRERRLDQSVGVGLASLALAAGAWLLGAGPAAGGNPPGDDGAPSGTLAFVTGGVCPPGWAVVTEAQGRLLVGVTDGAAAGATVGTPLADHEDRTHEHSYSGTVQLAGNGVFALNGVNGDGAGKGAYPVAGATNPQTTGLPFVQVQACAKP